MSRKTGGGSEAVPDLLARTATCYQETLKSFALRDEHDLKQALRLAYSDYLEAVFRIVRRRGLQPGICMRPEAATA